MARVVHTFPMSHVSVASSSDEQQMVAVMIAMQRTPTADSWSATMRPSSVRATVKPQPMPTRRSNEVNHQCSSEGSATCSSACREIAPPAHDLCVWPTDIADASRMGVYGTPWRVARAEAWGRVGGGACGLCSPDEDGHDEERGLARVEVLEAEEGRDAHVVLPCDERRRRHPVLRAVGWGSSAAAGPR